MSGLKKSITKVSKAAQHSSTVAPAQKSRGMTHPAGKSGNRMTKQMSAKSTVKTSAKATNRRTLFHRIKNTPLFGD